MMNSNHEPRATALQPCQREIPERPLPVQPGAHDFRRQRLELLLRPVLEFHLANVVPYVELSIELPTRKTKVEGRKHHTLAVAGNQQKLRFHERGTICQLDLTLEHADRCDIERLPLALDIQEKCISPGEGITLALIRHKIATPFQAQRRLRPMQEALDHVAARPSALR